MRSAPRKQSPEKIRSRFANAEAVNHDAADQQGDDRGQTVRGVEPTEHFGVEAQLLAKNIFQRINAVVDVVVPKLRETDKNQDDPSVSAGRLGTRLDLSGHRKVSGFYHSGICLETIAVATF